MNALFSSFSSSKGLIDFIENWNNKEKFGYEKEYNFENKLILLSFENCKVTDTDGKCYFEPAWGTFDMAVGNTIVSVFNGTADKNIFEDQLYVSPQRTFQQNYSSKDLVYQNIFQEIRNYREQKKSDDSLLDIWKNIKNNFVCNFI